MAWLLVQCISELPLLHVHGEISFVLFWFVWEKYLPEVLWNVDAENPIKSIHKNINHNLLAFKTDNIIKAQTISHGGSMIFHQIYSIRIWWLLYVQKQYFFVCSSYIYDILHPCFDKFNYYYCQNYNYLNLSNLLQLIIKSITCR